MNFYKVIYECLLVCVTLIPSKHALHMFQQNRYECGRYASWMKEMKASRISSLILPVLVSILVNMCFGFLKGPAAWLVSYILVAIPAGTAINAEIKKSYIKPLVYTNRVKRQIAVMSALLLVVMIAFYPMIGSRPITGWLILIMSVLPWAMVYPMAVITAPIEKAGRQKYLNEAKSILEKHNDLVKIGITGSYGKTTTKNVMQSVLSEQFLSLMTPASYNTPMGITRTIREYLKPVHQVFVCEMGADHVGDITELMNFVHPSIGVVTSIGPQHLQTFGSQENITKEKMQMIELLPKDGLGILNYDNKLIRDYKIQNPVRIMTYGIRNHDADYYADHIEYNANGSSFEIVHNNETYSFCTKLLGELNILNILSAVIAARELGVQWSVIQKTVKEMKQVEHRLELKDINGLRFIDDAFNANPSGAAMALEVLSRMPGRRIIVTPGMIDLGVRQEEINHTFGTQMKDKADEVLLVGEKQVQPIYEGLEESGFKMENVHVYATVKEAFDYLWANATSKDTILLENDLPDAFNR